MVLNLPSGMGGICPDFIYFKKVHILTPLIFWFAILSSTSGLSSWRSGLVPITYFIGGPIRITSAFNILYIYLLVVWIYLVAFIVSALIPPITLLYLWCSSSGNVMVLCLYGSYCSLIGVLAPGYIIIDILWVYFKYTHNYVARDLSWISSSVLLLLSFLPCYYLIRVSITDPPPILFSMVYSYYNWYYTSLTY